jgi:hypothetical protein
MNTDKQFEREIDPDLLAEIEEWEKTDHDEPAEYYFSNPDPYLKPQPLPSDYPRHNCCFNKDGHLCVKNLSAFWVPELTVTEGHSRHGLHRHGQLRGNRELCPQAGAHYQQKVCRKDGGFRMTNTESLGTIEATNPVLTVCSTKGGFRNERSNKQNHSTLLPSFARG